MLDKSCIDWYNLRNKIIKGVYMYSKIAKENFDLACKYYVEAKSLIRDYTLFIKNISPDFSFEVAMGRFDLILQSILIKVAISDGYFLEEEREFIKNITNCADIMGYLNYKGIDISWDSLTYNDDYSRKELSKKILNEIIDIIYEFVDMFAILDYSSPIDYCSKLTKQIYFICMALAFCDGDKKDSSSFRLEMSTAINYVTKLIEERWKQISKSN